MAFRARLAAPQPAPRQEWPWHQTKWTSLASHLLWGGDRRMEAETFLSSGYGLRLAIQERAAGWQRLGQLARVWQPSRLKGIQVSPDFGIPFLAATQVYDIRPVPRKWLALERTNELEDRLVKPGMILITCSGAVGRATLAHAPHEKTLISHDLLRVTVNDPAQWGWLYAYLRSTQARAMMTGAKYGHMIKHLEIAHLNALPVPVVNEKLGREFSERTSEILHLRNRAHQLSLDAEGSFERALGSVRVSDWGEHGYNVRASSLFAGRRRFEGVFHNPGAATIRRHLSEHGQGFTKLRDAGFGVWLPTRFRRIPAEDGVWLLDSAALFETNPDLEKCIADGDFGDPNKGRVKAGWLLLARSGQTYGINGSVVLATEAVQDKVVSDHVIRIAPSAEAQIRVGYLLTALSHPILGRPLVKALPYGSSIPEIDPTDFANFQIVRLFKKEESAIADFAEEAAALRAEADVRERALATSAGELIDRFVAGDMLPFVITMSSAIAGHPPSPDAHSLPEHTRVRLCRALPSSGLDVGAVGTIVHVYEAGSGYEVEFVEELKRPAVETLSSADIEELIDEDV